MGWKAVDPPSLEHLNTQRRGAPWKQDRHYFREEVKGDTWAN